MSNVPSLAELISIENPRAKAEFAGNSVTYSFTGTDEELEMLKNAVYNAEVLMFSGIEAVADLLFTAEVHCADELSQDSKKSALWLIKELSQTLQVVTQQNWMLNHVVLDQVEVSHDC